MFRACLQCATARVKCSGSTPCQRCGIKELECQYPVQNKKKPKTRKNIQARETFRTNEGNQLPGDETIINNLNASKNTHVHSWPTPQSTVPNSEIGIYQMQNHQSQPGSTLGDSGQVAEPSFIDDDFNVGQTYIQVSQAEQLRAWMRDSTAQQSVESFEPGFEGFQMTLPCDFPTNTTIGFANINQERSSVNWLSPPGTSSSQFSFEAQRYEGSAFSHSVDIPDTTFPFKQEAIFFTETPPVHQHEIYPRHQNGSIVQISSPVSIQSPNGFTSSPGKNQSPATSISPSLSSVYNSEDKGSLHFQCGTELENHLTVQIPHRMQSAPPPTLHSHSSSTSMSPSSASVYYNDCRSIIHPQHATGHQSWASWDGTRSTAFPSPRLPSTPNRQFQIPISIEKQVYEQHNPNLPTLIPTSVYATLMSQFKSHCLKHPQPFLSDYFPSAAVLELSAQLYFEHFHPIFPLLYKSPLDIATTTPEPYTTMLVLTMCAIGVGYLGTVDAWQCSEAFLEFFRRVLDHDNVSASESESRRKEILQLQAKILAVVAMFRSPNQNLVEQAYEGRTRLVTACLRGGLLGDVKVEWKSGNESKSEFEKANGGEWDEGMFIEAKRRAACCIWVRLRRCCYFTMVELNVGSGLIV